MKAYATSKGILKDGWLDILLGRVIAKPARKPDPDDIVIGWGQKGNTSKAKTYAAAHGLPFVALEDGFLGYMSHPVHDARRLSILIDGTGIYYDATRPSDLEILLNSDDWMTETLRGRATGVINTIRRWRLSKYNQSGFDLPAQLGAILREVRTGRVLVVDQTRGDMSISLGLGDGAAFERMLSAALDENPEAQIFVKVHPDVILGKKKGHFDITRPRDRVTFIADDCNPQALITEMDRVYVVTSQLGLEALIAGKDVACFGVPFYAGWGLTDDRVPCARRTAQRTLEDLVAAAFIKYARYADPFRKAPCEVEDVLDLLVADRQMPRPHAATAYAVGFSIWKRGFLPEFIGAGVRNVKFISKSKLSKTSLNTGDCVVLWGRKHDHLALTLPDHIPVWRMEDGFLRSVGLGTDLRRPSSLVLDRSGIYYDGGCPSDLETFLATHDFSDRELVRARALRASILEAGLSKYNVGLHEHQDFRAKAAGRRVVLVPGQVEGDASLRYGSPNVSKNADLLRVARRDFPDAYIVFKPHPDVISGNREGSVPADILHRCSDAVVEDIDIIDCIQAADHVVTMTSLTGFEALLRAKSVTCYGRPFYAGWGLTDDRLETARRGRGLCLDALVYALLVVYARYVDWPSGRPTTPEALVAEMAAMQRGGSVAQTGLGSRLQKWSRKAQYWMAVLVR